jgi:hypothetical protein
VNPLVPPLYEARVTDWIRRSLELKAGLQTRTMAELNEAALPKLDDPSYVALRLARMRMGHLRYGANGWDPDAKHAPMIRAKLDAYEKTGNREFLVDISNLAYIEWLHPTQPGTYFHAEDRAL